MSTVYKRTWYVTKNEVINGEEVIRKVKRYGWYINLVHNGHRVRRYGGETKAEAEKILAKLKMDALNDKLGVDNSKEVTLDKLIAEYLEYSKANKATNSYLRDKGTLKCFSSYFGNGILVSRIGSKELDAYKQQRLFHDKVSGQTVNRELNTILNMLRKAQNWQYRVDSSFSTVKKMPEKNQRMPRFLTLEDVARLLQACKYFDNVRKDKYSNPIYSIVFVALYTGLRRSELFNLQWSNVDFQGKRITVQSSRDKSFHPKSYRPRVIDLTDEAVEILARQKERANSEYVFSNHNGQKLFSVDKALKTVLKIAGIKDCGLHTLRHTFASYLVMAGVDLPTVKELMGHKDIKTTMIYSHLDGRHKREAVKKLPFSRPNVTETSQNPVLGIFAVNKSKVRP